MSSIALRRNLVPIFVVRTVVDRLAGDGGHTVMTEMNTAESVGTHVIAIRTDADEVEQVTLDIRYKRIHVRPPIGKQKRYPALDLTVIHASEIGAPSGRKPILWKLVTDLEVSSLAAAVEKIRWYALRWKIEVCHKILKSGCRAEDAKLRTADRLANLVALFCIVSWRVMWMTMIARIDPDADPAIALHLRKSPSSIAWSVTLEIGVQSPAQSSCTSQSWPGLAAILQGRQIHLPETLRCGAGYGA